MNKPIGIAHLEVPQSWIKNKPLYWYDPNNQDADSIRVMTKAFKELTGYNFDNTHLKWSNIYGDLFAISVHAELPPKHLKGTGQWDITIWDARGNTTIDVISFDIKDVNTDYIPNDIYRRMEEVTEDFSRGKVSCSGCGSKHDYSKIKHQKYFAGIYCNNCWETKYKAIESSETYE